MAPIVINVKREWINTIQSYFIRNPEALFIMGFQFSLIVCTGLLISYNSILEDNVATVAYFLLVIGVVVQLVSYVLEKRKINGI